MSAPIFYMPSARELRRREKQLAKRPQKDVWEAHRHKDINPVKEAVIRSSIEEDIQRLRTAVGLQAYIGEDAAMVANMAGRLVYIVCHAAGVHNLGETPAELERQRGAVIAGLAAIDRLIPKLHTFSLAAGSMELDNLLHSANGMGTADVRRALGMQV